MQAQPEEQPHEHPVAGVERGLHPGLDELGQRGPAVGLVPQAPPLESREHRYPTQPEGDRKPAHFFRQARNALTRYGAAAPTIPPIAAARAASTPNAISRAESAPQTPMADTSPGLADGLSTVLIGFFFRMFPPSGDRASRWAAGRCRRSWCGR